MKKRFCLLLLWGCVCVLGGCGQTYKERGKTRLEEPLTLRVVTTFAGNDGNAQVYREAYREWEEKTGYVVADMSTNSDETFKTRVINDFLTGSEPDVLFFFNGVDANSFIEANRVVSLDEIKQEYPEFASNLDVRRIPTSLVDNRIYAIPVSGYWEAMFVNTSVLKAAGVSLPGTDYTWEQFLTDCEQIKAAGFVPIAVALGNIPHYWWEFAIFNHTTPMEHTQIPSSVEAPLGQAWVAGIEDIKQLYELGYFPKYTNSVTDESTFTMFMEGKAAFMIDGSWKVGSIVQNCQTDVNDPSTLDEEKLQDYTVTFVPGTESRKATDLIGGMSMGYYITRKAWEDPAKREAAVSFVSHMTSDEVAPKFAQHTANILLHSPVEISDEYNSLQKKAMEMYSNCSSLTGAVQDVFEGECRVSTFDNMPAIVTGKVSPREAVEEGLRTYREQTGY